MRGGEEGEKRGSEIRDKERKRERNRTAAMTIRKRER